MRADYRSAGCLETIVPSTRILGGTETQDPQGFSGSYQCGEKYDTLKQLRHF